MVWIASLLEHHVFAPAIIFDVFRKFLIDRMHLPCDISWIEEGIYEEVGEAIEKREKAGCLG